MQPDGVEILGQGSAAGHAWVSWREAHLECRLDGDVKTMSARMLGSTGDGASPDVVLYLVLNRTPTGEWYGMLTSESYNRSVALQQSALGQPFWRVPDKSRHRALLLDLLATGPAWKPLFRTQERIFAAHLVLRPRSNDR